MKPEPQLLGSNVRKPTALVHFERALSTLEQKIMTIIIFHCQISEKDERGFYYIKKSFIREFLGWEESNYYPRIYEAFLGIYNNSIKWNLLGADRTFKSLMCRLIVSLLAPGETGQYIGFKLHPDLEPIIKDPKVFAKLKLIMMVLLTRPKYGYPLYELFADSYSRGQRTLRIPLEILKEYLGLSTDSYSIFKDFKTRILKPSIESINKVSDYCIKYETYRAGKTVEGILFQLKQQPWQAPILTGPLRELQKYYSQLPFAEVIEAQKLLSLEEQAFVESVKQYNVTESDAFQAIEMHGLEGAIAIRDYVLDGAERRKGTKGEVKHIGAYMVRCFQQGYGRKGLMEQDSDQHAKAAGEIARKHKETREKIQLEINQLTNDFWGYQLKLIEQILERMSPEDRLALDRKFILNNPMWAKKFQEAGLKTPMTRSAFYKFAVDELLSDKQKDIVVYAKTREVSVEALNLLQILL